MERYGTLAPGCQRARMEVEGPDTGLATLKAPLTGRRIESGDFDRLKNVEECEEHMAHIQPFVSFCHARLGSFASEAATVYFIQLQWSESQRLKKSFKGHSRNKNDKIGFSS